MNRFLARVCVVAMLGCASLIFADNGSAPTSQPVGESKPIDLQNTICPVSGDKVGDSKLTEIYDGKIYHFCCDDCPKDFKKDPAKYAKLVAADPAKYGVK